MYDLPIEWKPEPNEADESTPIPFDFNIQTTTWRFENGDHLELEKNDSGYLLGGYLLGGCIGGKDVHNENYEDFYFEDSDALLNFFKKEGLLKLLSSQKD